MSLLRTLRTLWPLRWSQPLWRLRYAIGRWRNLRHGTPGRRWAWSPEGAPPLRVDFPDLPPVEPPCPGGERLIAGLEAGVFEHLGESVEIGKERPDWRLGEVRRQRLWTVTLHYHGWAFALARAAVEGGPVGERAADLFRHYVGDWIGCAALERPGTAALAWNAYAVATRIGWWVRAHRLARQALFAGDPDFENQFLRSLWQQAAWLADHLEWDLRGNHLLRDLTGLGIAGRFFADPEADRWSAVASRLAQAQASEQFLADGAHFERSPKYHRDAMEDLLVLSQVAADPTVGAALTARWTAGAEALAWMRHPDGDLAQLNDGSRLGAEVVSSALAAGATIERPLDLSPRRGGHHLAETGLVIWHGDPWSVFFDVGMVGPAVQPGHAHADTLTIECSFRGHRLVVDPGSAAYDLGARRAVERGTAAHPTVCIDGMDSSEVWHVFRLGRRARPLQVVVEIRDDGLTASAAHDGYRHLPGRPIHRREVEVSDGGALVLFDRVEGHGRHSAEGGLLIEPGWEVEELAEGWSLRRGGDRLNVRLTGPVDHFTERRQQSPVYGTLRAADWLGWKWRGEPPLEVRTELLPG